MFNIGNPKLFMAGEEVQRCLAAFSIPYLIMLLLRVLSQDAKCALAILWCNKDAVNDGTLSERMNAVPTKQCVHVICFLRIDTGDGRKAIVIEMRARTRDHCREKKDESRHTCEAA